MSHPHDGIEIKNAARSNEWPRVRREHLEREPVCQWCGGSDKLEVHHIAPFHLYPSRELDPSNLITLCEVGGEQECHFKHGHLGISWKDYNPMVVAECIKHDKKGV